MKVIATLLITLLIAACAAESTSTPLPEDEPEPTPQQAEPTEEPMPEPTEAVEVQEFKLMSAAFEEGASIPVEFSCDGEDTSPRLTWTNPSEGTQSFALIMDDPDAPVGTWVHWVLFNLPSEARSLPVAVPADATLSNGATHGSNSWNAIGYGGPCPPGGEHRYFFKLHALDTVLDLEVGATKEQVLDALEGHILDQAELMGTFSR